MGGSAKKQIFGSQERNATELSYCKYWSYAKGVEGFRAGACVVEDRELADSNIGRAPDPRTVVVPMACNGLLGKLCAENVDRFDDRRFGK
jgi:hypothetical protein